MISSSKADTVDIEDGIYHSINDSRYQNDFVVLDGNIENNPGTHLELASGGSIYWVTTKHNSSITLNGGLIESRIELYDESNATINNGTVNDVWAGQNSHLHIYGGAITNGIECYYDSTVIINGGTIGANVESAGDAIIEIHGGTIAGSLLSHGNGTIYLYGSDFRVGGHRLGSGDNLRDYGTIDGSYLTGTVTGILEDNSILNNQFNILLNDLNADIIIIPEPATLVLLGLGGLWLRKRRL
jgi:hypothetical protein